MIFKEILRFIKNVVFRQSNMENLLINSFRHHFEENSVIDQLVKNTQLHSYCNKPFFAIN